MVFILLQSIRNYLKQNSKFLDSLRMHVKAGTGGFGFPRYGGQGGKGGDICFVATEGNGFLKYAIYSIGIFYIL